MISLPEFVCRLAEAKTRKRIRQSGFADGKSFDEVLNDQASVVEIRYPEDTWTLEQARCHCESLGGKLVEADEVDVHMIKDLHTYDPSAVSNEELLFDHAILHAWFRRLLRGEKVKDYTKELIIEKHLLVVGEMKKRGLQHNEVDELDRQTEEEEGPSIIQAINLATYDDHALKVLHERLHLAFSKALSKDNKEELVDQLTFQHRQVVRELKKRNIEHTVLDDLDELCRSTASQIATSIQKWANVKPGGLDDYGTEITKEQILNNLQSFIIKKGFVSLVGGLAIHGKTKGKADILIKAPPDWPQELIHPIKFRIGRQLDPELSRRIDWLMDDFRGEFTTYYPLYDLVLMRCEPIRIEMSLETEADASEKEDAIKPMRMIHMPKPVAFHDVNVTPEFLADKISYPCRVEKKLESVRMIVMKFGDEVRMISEDMTDNTKNLPGIVKELRETFKENVMLDGCIEGYKDGEFIPREVSVGMVKRGDEKFLLYTTYDIMYYKDKDLHKIPYVERRKILESFTFKQSDENTPDPLKSHLNLLPSHEATTKEEAIKWINHVSKLPGSEGAVIKINDSTYPLNGKASGWFKYKNYVELYAKVVDKQATKTPGVYNLIVGFKIPPNVKVPDKLNYDGWVNAGKTFNVKEDIKVGDFVKIKSEKLYWYTNPTTHEQWISIYAAKFVEKSDVAWMMDDAIEAARNEQVLIKKIVASQAVWQEMTPDEELLARIHFVPEGEVFAADG